MNFKGHWSIVLGLLTLLTTLIGFLGKSKYENGSFDLSAFSDYEKWRLLANLIVSFILIASWLSQFMKI